MDRLRRSFDLARASFAVLRADKELVIFPLLSFLALLIVLAVFAVPLIALIGGTPEADRAGNIGLYVLGFVFYVVAYSVAFFFNTALVGAALIRLDGGDPTLRDGLRIAVSRLPTIIAYALIAATVGQLLRWISERAGALGPLISGVLGFAWAVATYLVVPVLAAEGVGPVEAIRRSSSLLRQTWGEQLVGNLGLGLVFFLLALLVIVLGVVLIVLLAMVSTTLVFVGVVALIAGLALVGLLASAVGGIYTASLYRYATKGDGGSMFHPDTLAGAFRPRPAGLFGRLG
jgi:hypothetical protein